MKVRRFFAKDMRTALAEVSRDLGSEAAILSSRRVDDGVEILAAQDYEPSIFASMNEMSADKASAERANTEKANTEKRATESGANHKYGTNRVNTQKKNTDNRYSEASESLTYEEDKRPDRFATEVNVAEKQVLHLDWGNDPGLTAIKDEMRVLRSLMEEQIQGLAWKEQSLRKPLRSLLTKRLSLLDLSPRLRDYYAGAEGNSPEHAMATALASIAKDIQHSPDPMFDRGGVFALVGPTGVGKTTTVAKLAARFALEHGPRSVALISTDGFRIGGHDQLAIYARLIGCAIRTADTPSALSDALDFFVDKKLILIDTAGMSQRDTRLTEQLSLLTKTRHPISLSLVLSACAQRAVQLEIMRHFGQFPLHSTILTKLDEATSLGAVLSGLLESRIPLGACCDGQRVPEDIRVLRGAQLVDRALKMAEQYRESVDEWLLANEMKVTAHAGS